MHIKTNVELSSIQIITLAICPLLTVIWGVDDAIFFLAGTIACLILTQLFCLIFNKYLTKNVKAMLTAVITSFIVVVAIIVSKEYLNIELSSNVYFIIFSTTALSTDFIYFRNKATTKFYFLYILKIILFFSLVLMVFAVIKEFLAFGTIYNKQLTNYSGLPFFKTIVSDLLILATLCFIFDLIVRMVEKKIETKRMVYQKYVKIIRSEKIFQYDKLRRERLLDNDIEINKINAVDAEKIAQKESENEKIESVQDVISEESEIVEISEDSSENNPSNSSSPESNQTGTGENKKQKDDKKEDKK